MVDFSYAYDTDLSANPLRVLLKKGEWVDEERNGRIVPFKLYYPGDYEGGRLPLIVWSHGFGGNRDGAAFLSRYLAERGFILLHLTHPGTDSSLWEGKPGHPWDILKNTEINRETTLDRFLDVPFAMKTLKDWIEAEHSDIATLIDYDRVGMSGHSFGALTTQVMAGQLFPDRNDKLISLKQPDLFRAGILYSFTPLEHLTDAPPQSLYGAMDIPLLFMTGTDDSSPVKGFDYTFRLPVFDHAGSPEKFLIIKEDGDHMVYNGTRGKLNANPKRELHEEIIKVSSLAFWDHYLKNRTQAEDWLHGASFQNFLAAEAQLRKA